MVVATSIHLPPTSINLLTTLRESQCLDDLSEGQWKRGMVRKTF
jgi:hypothetical protein